MKHSWQQSTVSIDLTGALKPSKTKLNITTKSHSLFFVYGLFLLVFSFVLRFAVNCFLCIHISELLMTKTVDCFVVGHWALSHNKLTERHVSRHMTNLIDVQMEEDGYPQDMYECFIQTSWKEGDLVLDIGSENGNI